MTANQANGSAQAARQGEMNANPHTGTTTGTTNPNAASTSPNTATSSNAQQSQANCRQTKPLYECQATDIPWAQSSAGNSTPPPSH